MSNTCKRKTKKDTKYPFFDDHARSRPSAVCDATSILFLTFCFVLFHVFLKQFEMQYYNNLILKTAFFFRKKKITEVIIMYSVVCCCTPGTKKKRKLREECGNFNTCTKPVPIYSRTNNVPRVVKYRFVFFSSLKGSHCNYVITTF